MRSEKKRSRGSSAIFVLIILSSFAVHPALAKITGNGHIQVINTNDSGPGSLRDAITNASSGDTITFRLPTYPATITLSSTLSINTSLTIDGPGADRLAISGNHAVQVFLIAPGTNVSISGVTVEYGSDAGGCSGGGIENGGALTVSKSTILGNVGGLAGGISNGGALCWKYFRATLTVRDSNVIGNLGGWSAGIFNNIGSTATVTNTTLSANYGYAIYNYDGYIIVSGSLISGNQVGIIGNLDAVLIMDNTTISDNACGGIDNNATYAFISDSTISGNGCWGIWNFRSTLGLTNSTVFGNSGWGVGASICCDGLGINHSTISNNSGGIYISKDSPVFPWALVKNTILADNGSLGNCGGPSSFISGGHNLSDDGTCASILTATGDMNSTPAGLDPAGLKDNGGLTQTVALVAGSPAVNPIPVNDCTAIPVIGTPFPVTTDQRGIPRLQGGSCDIGAFEYAVTMPTPTSGVNCNGVYDGTFNGNIDISEGQQCIFLSGGVTGNVKQNGGSLMLLKSQVGGNIQINGAGTFTIGPRSSINGNLQIQNLPSASLQNQICGTTVGGDLNFENNGTGVLIGSYAPIQWFASQWPSYPPMPCDGNTVGSNLQVQNNWASTSIVGNTVGGNLMNQNNAAATQVFNNTVTGNLNCQNDTAIQGSGNIVGKQKQGQCSGF